MPGINKAFLDVITDRIYRGDLPFTFAWDLEAARLGDEEAYDRLLDQLSSYEQGRGAVVPAAARVQKLFRPAPVDREELAEHVANISGLDAALYSFDRTSLWIAGYALRRFPPHAFGEIKQGAVVVADIYRAALDVLANRGFSRETRTTHAVIRRQFEEMDHFPADVPGGVVTFMRQLQERFDLQDAILPFVRFPEGQHGLPMRAAAYVAFRQQAATWYEGAVRIGEINNLHDTLLDKIEFLGIPDEVIAREMVAGVMVSALNANDPNVLSPEGLDDIFVEMTDREIERLEEKGERGRLRSRMKIGSRLINAETYYQMLKRTQRAFLVAMRVGQGDFGDMGSGGSATSGGSGPVPATGSGHGPVASAKASFGGVEVEAEEASVSEDGAFLACDLPAEEGAWLFIAPNTETPPTAALLMNLPLRR